MITQTQTVKVEYTNAKVIKCVARETFDFGPQHVPAGTTFYLVRDSADNGEYHLVMWTKEHTCWQCSCGQRLKKHAHIAAVNGWVIAHIVQYGQHKSTFKAPPKVVDHAPASSTRTSTPVIKAACKPLATANVRGMTSSPKGNLYSNKAFSITR